MDFMTMLVAAIFGFDIFFDRLWDIFKKSNWAQEQFTEETLKEIERKFNDQWRFDGVCLGIVCLLELFRIIFI